MPTNNEADRKIGSSKLEKERRKIELSELITHVLRSWPGLHYFQGYHDIMSILLLVLNDLELAKCCAEKMSLHRLRDSMGPGLDPVLGYLRWVLATSLRCVLISSSPSQDTEEFVITGRSAAFVCSRSVSISPNIYICADEQRQDFSIALLLSFLGSHSVIA